MTDKPENQSASGEAGQGAAPETESAQSQREAFERLCEKIQSAMSGCRPWRPPEYCVPPEYCKPPFGPHHHPHGGPPFGPHYHHYCGPPHHYYGSPPSLSLLNHMFQFAGARAHFWHRWFESLSWTAYRSQPSYYSHDPYCYEYWHDPSCYGHWRDRCCGKHDPCCSELPDCEEFKDVKSAIKDFLSHLGDEQRQKFEPVLCEMIHCVSMMRRMDAMRRKPYEHRRPASAGPEWN